MQICHTERYLTAERLNEWSCGDWRRSGSEQLHAAEAQIPYSTVATWLMSVVSVPLDTRLLLCGFIQPHAIKQKSHCMQGWGEPRASSILPSRLSSPPRLSGVHALLSTHRGTQHTHHREPQGLKCLEVNRIRWLCINSTLAQVSAPERFFTHVFFLSFPPSVCQSLCPVVCPPAAKLAAYTCSSPGRPPETLTTIKTGRTDRKVRGQSTKEK